MAGHQISRFREPRSVSSRIAVLEKAGAGRGDCANAGRRKITDTTRKHAAEMLLAAGAEGTG